MGYMTEMAATPTRTRRTADPWRDTDVIDERAPRFNQAITGLVALLGALFGWLTYALKTAHNFVGPLFAVSLVIVFFTFLRDNFPGRGDLQWLKRGGGLFGGSEPPSGRFNAGEKLIFWGGVFAANATV